MRWLVFGGIAWLVWQQMQQRPVVVPPGISISLDRAGLTIQPSVQSVALLEATSSGQVDWAVSTASNPNN